MALERLLDLHKENILSSLSFHNVSDAIFWSNLKGEIFYVNDATFKLTGYSKKELSSMNLTDIDPSISSTLPLFIENLKSKKKTTTNSKFNHKAGQILGVEISYYYLTMKMKKLSVLLKKISMKDNLSKKKWAG